LDDKFGLDVLAEPGEEVVDFTINGRQAKKIPGNEQAGTNGMCDVGLDTGPNSRVLIVVTMISGTTEQACQFADQTAQLIEPKLPKS